MLTRRTIRTAVLALIPGLLVLVASPASPTTAAPPVIKTAAPAAVAPSSVDPSEFECSAATNAYRYHPTEIGTFCHPVWGWGSWGQEQIGRLPEDTPGMRSRSELSYATPPYTTAASINRSCEISQLLAQPVALREEALLPTRLTKNTFLTFVNCADPDSPNRRVRVTLPDGVNEFRLGCVGSDAPNKPCFHRNRWSDGPFGGWSECDLTSCQTRGHQAQNGYDDFLAHYEVWSNMVESYVLFDLCGERCAPPVCSPGDQSPGCTPCPTNTPDDCNPPPFCERFPDNAACRLEPIPDLTFDVRISLPDRFAAKGTTLSQGATVTSVELLCRGVPCRGDEPTVDVTADSLTGRLVLDGSGTYKACAIVRGVGCGFFVNRPDRSGSVVAGDLVGANFFTPTRSTEKVVVRFDGLRGTVDRYQMVPVLVRGQVSCAGVTASYCRGRRTYEDWVPSGELRRQFVRTDPVPVTVRDQNGNVMTSSGFARPVIGTVGG